jgi:cytochrome c551
VVEAIFFILAGVFIVSAPGVGLLAAKGGLPDKAVPAVVAWFAAVAVATCVFGVIYGNQRETSPPPEVASAGGETAEEEPAEESGAAEEEGGAEQENGVANAGEQLEGEAGPSTEGGNPELGATVFSENCSTCHGATGHGGNGGPDLTTMPKAQEQAGAEEQVTKGGGGMPAFEGQLSEEEIENVAAYVVQEINGGE